MQKNINFNLKNFVWCVGMFVSLVFHPGRLILSLMKPKIKFDRAKHASLPQQRKKLCCNIP